MSLRSRPGGAPTPRHASEAGRAPNLLHFACTKRRAQLLEVGGRRSSRAIHERLINGVLHRITRRNRRLVRILSVDGGGYLGFATASLLEAAERDLGSRCSDRFDLFCGTSTGAIIVLAFAAGHSAADVAGLYERLGHKIFPSPGIVRRHVPKLLRRMLGTAYNGAPLREALRETFKDQTLGDLRARGKRVIVTAFCLTTGRPRLFKTDHGPQLKAHDQYLLRDIAMGSAAAPSYLPIVEINDPATGAVERFIDGGVCANSPALLAYAEAVSHLDQPPAQVQLLSVATPRADLAERASARTSSEDALGRGLFGWSSTIGKVMVDGTAMVNGTALQLIMSAAGGRYERIELPKPSGLELDVVTPKTTETLRQLGVEIARSSTVRERLIPFFCDS